MGNVIDLEAYRSQKMEGEIEDLKQELKDCALKCLVIQLEKQQALA